MPIPQILNVDIASKGIRNAQLSMITNASYKWAHHTDELRATFHLTKHYD